ncbi:FAD/NAD(P)-binding protein [Frankia gtarii]|uniref:FAD/NAD(P)-binding protein n=1 Tax=Frankia gtarii TaxID=2950102 RepID=UPI0021BFF331|nr:FAD/NAD(P)-binding protein [Frankia gtarii]
MRIAVVGGGASAVCVIDALARLPQLSGDLTVFEPAPHLWRGRAYQPDADVVLINSTVKDMSVRHGDEGHFERWLADRYALAGEPVPDFAPRAVYGDYLEQAVEEDLARLRERGWRTAVVRQSVTGASRVGGRVVLRTDAGPWPPFDYVVLAVGGGQPKDTFGLAGCPGFIGDPYPVTSALSAVGPAERVVVIGTGLTAVDVVIALAAGGHRGPISLVSRMGALPAVRQHTITHELRHFTPTQLHAMAGRDKQIDIPHIARLLSLELTETNADFEEVLAEILNVSQEPPVQRLRRQLTEVSSVRTGLRVLQKAVPGCGPDLWPMLPEKVRKDVLGSYYRILMSLCCPMPPCSARTLLQLIDGRQLSVLGGIRYVEALPEGGFCVATDNRKWTVDRVVNGVSAPRHRIPSGAARLVDALTDSGLAVLHPDGGLCAQTESSRLTGDAPAGPGVYAVGDITGGTFFFTFGVPSLVDRSHDIVTDILAAEIMNRTEENSYV